MTRDGLVEYDLATGEKSRISKRDAEFDFRAHTDGSGENYAHARRPAETDSRSKKWQYTQSKSDGPGTPASKVQESFSSSEEVPPEQDQATDTQQEPAEHQIDPPGERTVRQPEKAKQRQHGTQYQRKFIDKRTLSDSESTPDVEQASFDSTRDSSAGGTSGSSPGSSGTSGAAPSAADTRKPSKSGRLQFTKDEVLPEETQKLTKLRGKAERNAEKLEQAKEQLPAKRRVCSKMEFDEKTGTSKRRLQVEKEVKTKGQHLKGTAATRPVKTAGNAALDFGHRKISEVEHENVGTEAAHKGERIAESGVRSAFRFHKIRPYRRVERLEQKSIKSSVKYSYQKALQDNPKLQTNPISRMLQKRKIQRQYVKAAKEAKRAGKTAKNAAKGTEKAVTYAAGFIKRHPALVGGAILILLLIFFITTTFSSCSNMAGGGFAQVFMSSYTAEDSDILAVDAAYSQLESQLQSRMDNIESEYSGYDEYNISLPQIGHNPYELASYLTCLYYDYTLDDVQSELENLLGQQYTLTITETVEVRYRKETYYNDDGSSYTEEVAYNYYILNVTLTNRGISAVAAANLDADLLSLYNVYMETKGNKPDLFDSIYIGGGDYLDYTIPGEALSDERFAAMIAEAEKYLGYPYVWGGSSPSTSFDCSGFVCWVINQSGVGSVGRTTATGLMSYCDIIPASEAQPGDLIFFQGTYDTPGASHVGIYVGDGVMLHCGSPIQYTSINTSYWQAHFYCIGRLP